MEEKKSKKKNIFLFFLKMLLIYILFNFISSIGRILPVSIMDNKYGAEFIFELFLAFFVLIAMLLAKNKYVFTEKKKGFFKSILIGITILIISLIILVVNISSLESFPIFNFINLILFCFTVGIAEEFMCRGWIQNEFIERFGSNRKQVILSIALSSLIFGLIHLSNIFAGQTIFLTIMQVIQTTGFGFLLGSIYYRTKNIWAVVFLHGFYDLAIMTGDLTTFKECTYGVASNNIVIYNILVSVIISAIYILSSIIIIRKSQFNKTLDENYIITEEEKKKDKKLKLIISSIIVILFIGFTFIAPPEKEYEEYETCYEFETKTVKWINGYTITFPQIDKKIISYQKEINIETTNELNEIVTNSATENYEFEIYFDDENMLVIENKKTKEIVELDDGLSNGFILKENELDYELIIHSTDMIESFIYYTKINKADISNSKDFLENIKKSLIKLDSPLLEKIGYITFEKENETYPLLVTDLEEYFIIDKDKKVKLLEFDWSE